ncbi:RNaseH domain-containing protein [Streptomyces sp. NPDC019826]|uniref:RNaseH domain-containing protein n=1 Tax=Streptomyces sp. NPDC019826 TaxID=3156667 RepID=UPI00340911C0
MEMFRRIEAHIDQHCETYRNQTPLYIEVPGLSVPTTKTGVRTGGPLLPEHLPAAMDAAGIERLLLVVLYHNDEVRSRVQREIARQWHLGDDFIAQDGDAKDNAIPGRVDVLFLEDKVGALAHGPATAGRRQQQLGELLAPFQQEGRVVAAICETEWDPNRKYPTPEERKKAEAEDGKWPSKAALAGLEISSQYIKQAPPSVPTVKKNGEPCKPYFIERETKARESGLANSTENAVRDLFRGLGVIDHRLGAAFGKIPLPDHWHIGIHIRRHAQPRQYGQRNTKAAPITIVLTAIRPIGDVTEPWTAWAYSPITSRWEPYRKTRLAVHSAALGLDVSAFTTIGDESHQASAAAQITEAALLAARTQLPHAAPLVIYVNGDTSEPIWAGIRDENLGQKPPADLPRAASWLPGHGLPRTQRPLAIVRTITDIERIGRPTGGYIWGKNGTWERTKTTESPFQLVSDDGSSYLPDFLLTTVPRPWAAGPPGRFGAEYSRFAPEAAKRQGKNGYAHTAVRLTVIPTADDANADLIGKGGIVLINQGVSWDGRQTEPSPYRLAKQIDTDHPYYRRSCEEPEAPLTMPEPADA